MRQAVHEPLLGAEPTHQAATVARNVSTRYLAIAVEMVIGLLLLPFNIEHLGPAAYGLWVLTASLVAYFSALDLGYSGALVKFVAQYRALRDARALNEILSTMFCLFAAFGLLMYLVALLLAPFLDSIFNLGPDQARIGRTVLLIVAVHVAAGTAFGVFGAVINGFQRYDLNNIVGTVSVVVVALVNVAVLASGHGLVALVAATTAVRVATFWIYRANAYRVFPGLTLRPRLFNRGRLREVTVFSVYIALIDWSNRLNFAMDTVVIGVFLNTSAVAMWAVAQRVADATQRLTVQLSEVLFPAIVDHDAASRLDALQRIFLIGTRLSLATVVPMCLALILMAQPLVQAWVGPTFTDSAVILQLLALSVIFRVGTSTSTTLLKGAGRHRFVATVNAVTAVLNLSLSVLLVRHYGLSGVALGTLVPIAVLAVFVKFPAGCRRVGVSVAHAVTAAVWPAVWPAGPMAAYLVVIRPFVGTSLAAVAALMLSALAIYAAMFLALGVSAAERRFLLAEFRRLGPTVRGRLPMPRVSEGA
jgi:O-antigen/teichoic acid export membrane protein